MTITKKLTALVLSSLLMFGAMAIAQAEAGQETLQGYITQIGDQQLTILDDLEQEIVVNMDEKTQLDTEASLIVGDYITVFFGGAMTASLPPQIYAEKIRCVKLEGEVTGVFEDGGSITIQSPVQGEVVVHLPEGSLTIPAKGSYVVIYYSGAMTMSLPPQVAAQVLEVYGLITGKVTSAGEDHLLVDQGEKGLVQVNFADESLLAEAALTAGDQVEILYTGKIRPFNPPQVNGARVSKAAGEKPVQNNG